MPEAYFKEARWTRSQFFVFFKSVMENVAQHSNLGFTSPVFWTVISTGMVDDFTSRFLSSKELINWIKLPTH